tara:strand:- start:2268 stop:3056 length:789 start_codon:yes stop_codon:yes gene_type:complete
MYQHFLITRFNLKKTDWNIDKNSREVLDSLWLKRRVELFKDFCLPSVLGQNSKNFKWLIFFQEGSQKDVKDLLSKFDKFPFIEAVFLNGYEEFQNNLPDIIQAKLKNNPEWLLTTRLDNDDALQNNYIKELQKALELPVHNTVFHFPNGLFLDLVKKIKLGYYKYPLNQFVSLLEKIEENKIKTVLSNEHDKWGENYSIQALPMQDAWLQITHEQNMVNSFKGVPVFSNRLSKFSIKPVSFKWNYDLNLVWKGFKNKLKSLY